MQGRLFSPAGYFASIDSEAANDFATAYAAEFGTDAAQLNTLGQSAYDGLQLLGVDFL